MLLPISGYAQSSEAITPKALDTKAEVIKIKQDNQDNLNTSVAELEKENNQLEKEIITLRAEETDINSNIKKNEASLELLTKVTNPTILQSKEIEKIKITIKELNNKKIENQAKINDKQTKIDANKIIISDTKERVKNNQNELTKEINGFQNDIFIFIIGISKYIGLIIFYWVLVQGLRYINNRLIPNETIRNIIALILTFLAIFATFITIFVAFAGNTTYLGPTLGVFSAALVVALQDFIASFFAWVIIKARGPYKLNDIIEIPTPSGVMTGVVTQIGFFRTRIKEKIGGESRDREQFTGKTIFFPNNLILKQGFRNFSFDNKILWHSIVITITFESDFEVAKKSLEDLIHKQFRYMLDHKDIYLDDVYNLKHIYKPTIYLHISNYGPEFTIWIPARLGTYREISEKISLQILKDFKHNKIELAYPTSRIVRREDLDRNYTEFDAPHPTISH
ncbi:MAG: mechanosensitive ion channel [candidate division SR1 bacterium]|nr:mechanosensitive ion channel [candidate division SR1 bacterium]